MHFPSHSYPPEDHDGEPFRLPDWWANLRHPPATKPDSPAAPEDAPEEYPPDLKANMDRIIIEACAPAPSAGTETPTPADMELAEKLFDEAHHYLGRFDDYQKCVMWLVAEHRKRSVESALAQLTAQREELQKRLDTETQMRRTMETRHGEVLADLSAARQERDEAKAAGEKHIMDIWLRCLGDQIYPKSHHIDALGKTTRQLTEDRNKAFAERDQLKELREGDNQLIRALAESCGIKITASDKLLGVQWEQFHDGVRGLFTQLTSAQSALPECGKDKDATNAALEISGLKVRSLVNLLTFVRNNCRVIYYPPSGTGYPIEHAPLAKKDSWHLIEDAARSAHGGDKGKAQ